MRFKEIDIDLPYEEDNDRIKEIQAKKGISYDEAVRLDYEENWKEKRHVLGDEAETVCEKIVRECSPITTKSFSKLLINCRTGRNCVNDLSLCMGICEVFLPFDFDSYRRKEDYEKIQMLISLIEAAAMRLIQEGMAEFSPMKTACEQLKNRPFENTWIWKKKRLAGGFTASILMEHTLKEMRIYACFERKKDELMIKQLLKTCRLHYLDYQIWLGKLEAEGEYGIKLTGAYGCKSLTAHIPQDMIRSLEEDVKKKKKEVKKTPKLISTVCTSSGHDFFWKIIDGLDWSKQGDDEKVIRPVVSRLAEMQDEDIFCFEESMAELLFAIDGEKWAKDVYGDIEDMSDDDFLYTRCVALVNGKAYYERIKSGEVLLDPDLEFESLLEIPVRAWEKKYEGQDMEYPYITKTSYETGGNTENW